MADMLSRARYFHEEEMMAREGNEELSDGGYILAIDGESSVNEVLPFKEELYEGRLKEDWALFEHFEETRRVVGQDFQGY